MKGGDSSRSVAEARGLTLVEQEEDTASSCPDFTVVRDLSRTALGIPTLPPAYAGWLGSEDCLSVGVQIAWPAPLDGSFSGSYGMCLEGLGGRQSQGRTGLLASYLPLTF